MATYALIPGGGGDPWEWHRLVAELTSRGQDAIAIRLPAEDARSSFGAELPASALPSTSMTSTAVTCSR
jgi:hypothetical protein